MHPFAIEEPLPTPAQPPELVISVSSASKKFCRTLNGSLRYMAMDVLGDLVGHSRNRSPLRPGEFWALHNVSFEVRRGQSLGVMGLNGAGKSTLLKLMLGSLRLTEGKIAMSGRPSMLSEHGLGFDPLLTGRENVFLAAAVLAIDRGRVEEAFDDIVAFAELRDFIDSPVRGYSAGMRSRLGFSVAMCLEPEILLVDEVLTVGDIGFQRRCVQQAQRYLQRAGSLVLVSHNPHLVQLICDRCLVLDRGSLVWDGDVVEGVARYLRAARTPLDDPLTFDAALTVPTPAVPVPSGNVVDIDDYSVRPINGTSLRTGEPARVSVRYGAARDVDVRWGFSLLSSDLATTITSEGIMDPVLVHAGRGELSAIIPRLPLAAGRYALRVAITDPHSEMPYAFGGYHAPPRYFTVDAPTSRRNNYRMYTRDLVVLEDLHWERRELGESEMEA